MLRLLALACLCGAFQDVEGLIRSADSKFQKDDYRGALQDYNRALALDSNRADAYVGRGKTQLCLKSLIDALDDFTRATDADPHFADAWIWRGRAQQLRGDHARAARDLGKGLELGIRSGFAFEWHANSLLELERLEEAEATCSRALDLGEQSADLYGLRAQCRFRRGNMRAAIPDFTRAARLDPKRASASWGRGLAYFGEHSWENAVRDLRRDAELDPATPAINALWIFLSRSRNGDTTAAAEEARELLKRSPLPGPEWARKILAYLLGDLPEADLVKGAEQGDPASAAQRRRGIHFFQGQKSLLAGRPEEALDHFRKSADEGQAPKDPIVIQSRAELSFDRREKKQKIIEILEAALRAMPAFEAVYEIDHGKKAPEDQDYRTIRWSVDMGREELLVGIEGRDIPAGKDIRVLTHLKDARMTMWTMGLSDEYVETDLTPVKDLYRMGGEVQRLLPATGLAEGKTTTTLCLMLGLILEGKPDKDGKGLLRFYTGLGAHSASWLREAMESDESTVRLDGDAVIVEIPSRRKKMVLDGKTGVLRRIEVSDYDGAPRAIRLRSYKILDHFPPIPERPAKLKHVTCDFSQLRGQMMAQEEWLRAELWDAFESWDRIAKAGKEGDVVAVFTRWAARYADGLHAYAVRTIAGRKIQQALDLGTPPAELLKEASREAATFAKRFSDERKSVDQFLKQQLDELVLRTETTLIEELIDSRLHETIRATLLRAFDLQKVDALRRETYGDRLEPLYREELAARTKL